MVGQPADTIDFNSEFIPILEPDWRLAGKANPFRRPGQDHIARQQGDNLGNIMNGEGH